MAHSKKYSIDFLPVTISDSSQLVKVTSASVGSGTFTPTRPEDGLWQWSSESGTHYLHGKNPDNPAKPYLGVFNEFSGRFFVEQLDINFQSMSVINTPTDGLRIGCLVDFGFTVSLQDLQSSNPSLLAISENDKIENFISQTLLADRDANAGSVLVHSNGVDISRIDFEQCFGYNGTVYDVDVLTGLGTISPGPFLQEIRNVLSLQKVMAMPIIRKIKAIDLERYLTYSKGLIHGLSFCWPGATNELLATRDHIHRCLTYRQQNIEDLISVQLSKV